MWKDALSKNTWKASRFKYSQIYFYKENRNSRIKWRHYTKELPPRVYRCFLCCVRIILIGQRWVSGKNNLVTTWHHTLRGRAACGRAFALVTITSLCLINSDSLHGFCHFHLNCKSHWWWLLFHLHNFPPCPTTANFLIDNCPSGTIYINNKTHFLSQATTQIHA